MFSEETTQKKTNTSVSITEQEATAVDNKAFEQNKIQTTNRFDRQMSRFKIDEKLDFVVKTEEKIHYKPKTKTNSENLNSSCRCVLKGKTQRKKNV